MHFFLSTRNESRLTCKDSPTRINKVRKTPAESDCPIALPEDLIAVDDDNVRTTPIMSDKNILELVESSKNVINADSDDGNEMNNVQLLFPHHPK
ncbi:hypothetical protein TNCV_4246081 [Trichonephila clavipes]|nr:hypothetical protein TNCV_4246081 [Trichonephila clavipes]